MNTTSTGTWARDLLEAIKNVAEKDVPECYKGRYFEWSFDFMANFPWNQEGQKAIYKLLWSSPQFARYNKTITERAVAQGVKIVTPMFFPQDEGELETIFNYAG